MKHKFFIVLTLVISIFNFSLSSQAQTSSFTYQGKLTDGGMAANGTYQFEFKLFDAVAGGNQVGQTLSGVPATVTNGVFAVNLDFGAASFNGSARFLEISVKLNGSGQPYTNLNPRQPVTSAPYSVRSLNANEATTAITSNDSLNLGGVPAAQYTQTTDPRLSDARNPLPNSPNYIQNTTNLQTSSNFNVSGEGKANIFSALTQFNIGTNRILHTTGFNNIFVGVDAGKVTTGGANAFFGNNAGKANTSGNSNAFFGIGAGAGNLTGSNNSFFGTTAGVANTSGASNSFFGDASGYFNTIGFNNSFFGLNSGFKNTEGISNTALGSHAGFNNTTGDDNVFLGYYAGKSNTTENRNTFIGYDSNGAAGITNSTAIGANAVVTESNTMVLGTNIVTVKVPGNLAVANTFSANALDSATVYKIGGVQIFHKTGTDNLFAGVNSGIATTGGFNAFFGAQSGKSNTTGFNNTFTGTYAGNANTTGANNAFFGANSGLGNQTGNFNAFFGSGSGFTNISGTDNSFFGASSGLENISGSGNSFFGRSAGKSVEVAGNNSFFGAYAGENTTTGGNAYFGSFAGQKNTTGFSNVFFGLNAGKENTGGTYNTFVGANSGQGAGALGNNNTALGYNAKVGLNVTDAIAIGANSFAGASNAIAIGANSFAGASNSIVLGTNGTKTFVKGELQVASKSVFSADISVGGSVTASSLSSGSLNVGGGKFVVPSGFGIVTLDSSLAINGNISAGGATFGETDVYLLKWKFLGGGSNADICYGDSDPTMPLSQKFLVQCSSSRRYKENIADYKSGLALIKNLRPVTFDWKENKRRDIGFVAEEVAEAEPLLATYNSDGQIQGVKYAQITTALVNAVKEQQAEIETQKKLTEDQKDENQKLQDQIKAQQTQIDALKTLVCASNPTAAVCKQK